MNPRRVFILDMFAENSPPVHYWDPPDLLETVGPRDLVALIRGYREFIRERRKEFGREIDTLSALSDAGLETVVLAAYRASFLTDEGRPIRARLVARRQRDWYKD